MKALLTAGLRFLKRQRESGRGKATASLSPKA
jgi:hypothetical protein